LTKQFLPLPNKKPKRNGVQGAITIEAQRRKDGEGFRRPKEEQRKAHEEELASLKTTLLSFSFF